jgi:hypothetical protein
MIRAFEPSFVTQYQPAFTELVRLGSVAAQKKINGRDTLKEDEIAQRMFIVLQALDSDGLTVKQAEALEYCLLRLNESLSGPTVEALVSLTPTETLIDRMLRAWRGTYTMTMQEVVMTRTRVLTAGVGSFSLSGQAATLNYSRLLAMAPGAFSYTGIPATLTYTEIVPYEYGLILSETVGGAPSWRALFDDGANPQQLNITGTGSLTPVLQKSSSNVTVTVYKTSNSGIAEDDGSVRFRNNGAFLSTQAFSVSDNLDGTGANYKQYVFTGLSEGDELDVVITEG